ncbi:hypothetical protein Avbf_01122 [Armadillidium vulgare]|nr:hypothetical protein Avbf_01122 [Armadillidium vulgare]
MVPPLLKLELLPLDPLPLLFILSRYRDWILKILKP